MSTQKEKIIILSAKQLHRQLLNSVSESLPEYEWIWMEGEDDFNESNLERIKPLKVFIPHWSKIIKEDIYNKYELIVFHMTDLPFGRGGSPLQNLIVNGFEKTFISAIRVRKDVDSGEIYLKRELSLLGTAEEILIRAGFIIEKMITEILKEKPIPKQQNGEPVFFKRRKPEDGNLINLDSINDIYNYIRMLDAEGYPRAFIEFGSIKIEFSRASLRGGNKIIADVRIFQK